MVVVMWGLWLVNGSGGMVVVAGSGREWWVEGLFFVFAFSWEKEDREKDADFNIKELKKKFNKIIKK